MKVDKLILVGIVLALIGCVKREPSDVVSISKSQLLVNNETYFIKGICYHPVPQGSTKRSFDLIDQDLSLMVEADINTIRVCFVDI